MNPESFKEKLYDPRDVEGNPNIRVLELIREIEEKFKNNPAFVGIVPRGSTVHGYSTETSDLDLLILFDSSKIQTALDDNSFQSEYMRQGVQFFFLDVNPDLVTHDLELNPDKGPVPVRNLAALTEMVTGDKVGNYRKIISEKFSELPSDSKENIKKRVIDLLMDKEAYSAKKIARRIPDLVIEEEQFLLRRRKLWEDKFDRIWLMEK